MIAEYDLLWNPRLQEEDEESHAPMDDDSEDGNEADGEESEDGDNDSESADNDWEEK